MDLIIVVLGADTRKDRASDSMKLIEYAYKRYHNVNVEEAVTREFELWKQINQNRIYVDKATNSLELKLDEIKIKSIATDEEPTIEISAVSYLEAPILENTRIGTVAVKVGDELIEEIEIKVAKEVKKRGILDYIGIMAKIYSGAIKILN